MVSEAYLKCLLQVHAPTGVTHCAVAHFTLLDARGNLPDLIVTTSSLLQLYSVRLVALPESFLPLSGKQQNQIMSSSRLATPIGLACAGSSRVLQEAISSC